MNINNLVPVAILMLLSSMASSEEGIFTDEAVFVDGFESQQITSIVDDPENSVGFDSSIAIGIDNNPVIS